MRLPAVKPVAIALGGLIPLAVTGASGQQINAGVFGTSSNSANYTNFRLGDSAFG